jgi:hypothetical protein
MIRCDSRFFKVSSATPTMISNEVPPNIKAISADISSGHILRIKSGINAINARNRDPDKVNL